MLVKQCGPDELERLGRAPGPTPLAAPLYCSAKPMHDLLAAAQVRGGSARSRREPLRANSHLSSVLRLWDPCPPHGARCRPPSRASPTTTPAPSTLTPASGGRITPLWIRVRRGARSSFFCLLQGHPSAQPAGRNGAVCGALNEACPPLTCEHGLTRAAPHAVPTLYLAARSMLRVPLPIKCVEAAFLGLLLTGGWPLDRVPLGFKSRGADGQVQHRALGSLDLGLPRSCGGSDWAAVQVPACLALLTLAPTRHMR